MEGILFPRKIIDVLKTIRSRGELLWLTRVIAEMTGTKKSKEKKFFSRINAWDIYFIVIALLYIMWRARVFFERFVSHALNYHLTLPRQHLLRGIERGFPLPWGQSLVMVGRIPNGVG